MNEVTNKRKLSVKDMLMDFDLLQYQLECAEAAVFALRIAEENMDAEGITVKALYVVQAFMCDLSREQREWYETAKEAAGLK